MLDTKAIATATALIVKEHVAAVVEPLLKRLDELEARQPERGEKGDAGEPGQKGEPGANGKDAQVTHEMLVEAVKANVDAINEAVAAYISENPPPSGKDADPEVVRQMVVDEVAKIPPPKDGENVDPADVQKMVDAAVAAIPRPENGKDADPEQVAALVTETAERVLSGWERPQDGKSVTVDDVQPLLADLVDKAVAAIPVPKDGAPGKDGADVSGGTIDREGHLIVTLSNGETKDFGLVVGRDGIDADMSAVERRIKDMFDAWPKPKDGIDGIGFDDMLFETREDGCYLVWEKGDIVKEARLPIPMDRGVYKEGSEYRSGDGVTWGGNYYIAAENTSAKPDSSKDGKPWRMAVRRGRDGKDATTKPEKTKA